MYNADHQAVGEPYRARIGHSIAAPYAGMVLGELGAKVIKLEHPGSGDYARGWGPPFAADGVASTFHAVNRAKLGVAVDLADERAASRLLSMIDDSVDVVLHNLKFGALERLGLGAEALLRRKPGLIVCNMGAFGAEGPLRDQPGYDPLMQAFSGLMSMLGEEDRPPVRVGVSIIDITTGLWAVIGVLAALREKDRTGIGGIVDTSLFETALAWMGVPIANFLCSGDVPVKSGSGAAMIVPYQAFATRDGFLMVAAGNDNLFRRLATALGLPDLASDPRFRANADRVTNRDLLLARIEPAFADMTTEEAHANLTTAGVPSGPLLSVPEVLNHPQTAAVGMIQRAPEEDGLSLTGLPLRFDGIRPAFDRAAPSLGQDNHLLHEPGTTIVDASRR